MAWNENVWSLPWDELQRDQAEQAAREVAQAKGLQVEVELDEDEEELRLFFTIPREQARALATEAGFDAEDLGEVLQPLEPGATRYPALLVVTERPDDDEDDDEATFWAVVADVEEGGNELAWPLVVHLGEQLAQKLGGTALEDDSDE